MLKEKREIISKCPNCGIVKIFQEWDLEIKNLKCPSCGIDILPKKEIVCFDDSAVCGDLAFGYSNKKEAIKEIEAHTGEKIEEPQYMEKLKVIRYRDRNGEIMYSWKKKCPCCGQKNNGVWSWANFV
jgi:uncharacterized C2H2 Zn-finger protein